MKKTMFMSLLILGTIFDLIGQDGCSKYYTMTDGSFYEYTLYNKKGKQDGVTRYKVTEVTTNGSAVTATLDIKLIDKKGKEVYNTNYSYTCEDDIIKIDYKSLFPAQMMQQYANMEMDITGSDIEIPNNLNVGKELANAHVAIDMNMAGMNMNITVTMTDRKVENKETITTPVGSFDCYVIAEKNTSKTMGITNEMNTKLWLAEGIGMVKQEIYKKNGDLISKTELTKHSK
ncbi:hypothetical protein [Maribacter sp. 2304DJ31-5]|uniref:TapB family protein n=1 Tax=Maribacter sp. 2304DJ31-5 TaxID=3386273 RepID=UPI0039BCADE5